MSDNGSNGRYQSPWPLPESENGSNGAMGDELSPEQLTLIWENRAQILAKPPAAEIGGKKLDLIVFRMSGERFGVEIEHVREVYPLVQITPVPRTPAFVAGVLSVRGRVVSVLDLGTFLGLSAVDLSDESKIVVVTTKDNNRQENDSMEVGLLTEQVEGTLTINESDLEAALATQEDLQARYTLGIAPGMLLVLDIDALLNSRQIVVNDELP